MPQQPIEIILARQFADSMNMAVFLVNPIGDLLFYNQAAEGILGVRFSDTGKMLVADWATRFKPTDKDGTPLPPEGLPLVQTTITHKPANGALFIQDADGSLFEIMVTSIPIEGRSGEYLGAMALFWKTKVV